MVDASGLLLTQRPFFMAGDGCRDGPGGTACRKPPAPALPPGQESL
ncbi:hypothetical protein LG3211_3299 [Lysobacter gummosus]|nr:hypothetical protein LG3211_3299 [Lysobacter gummosus]